MPVGYRSSPSDLRRVQSMAHESPELALVTAVILVAKHDALDGDRRARAWLAGPHCLPWLALLQPDDPEALQARLLEAIKQPA